MYAKTHVVTTLSSEEAALRLGIIMKLLLKQNYRFDVFFYFPVSVKNICNGKYTPMPSDNNGWSLYKAVVQSFLGLCQLALNKNQVLIIQRHWI